MIDYTLNNTTCFNNLKNYFLVLNNDTILALDYRYGFYLGKITADIK